MIHIDLHSLILDHINEIGVEESVKVFKLGESAIRKILAGTRVPDVQQAQIILDLKLPGLLRSQNSELSGAPVFSTAQPPQGQTIPAPEEKAPEPRPTTIGEEVRRVFAEELANPPAIRMHQSKYCMLMPTTRDINPYAMLSVLGNWKSTLPPEVRDKLAPFNLEKDTQVHHARNVLAQRFLESGREWSIWFDSDQILPIGNANWFRRRTGSKIKDEFLIQSALERLTSHDKPLVGGLYVERKAGGNYLAAIEDRNPNEEGLAKQLRKSGPQNKLIPVPWLAFGCVAVHRSVFEAILEKFPQLAAKSKEHAPDFFTPFLGGPHGEDTTFCHYAVQAGIQPHLDLGCWAGHIGQHCFMP